MALEKIVIEIDSNSPELNATIAQLEKLGVIDKKNSDQFKKSSKEHQQALKDTGSEVDRIENKMRNLAERLVAIFAVERIYEFASESVKAFEQAELAAKKLEFAITKINGGTQEAFKKLIEQSEKLSASLNNLFTPKQIQNAQTQLANFGLTTKQIQQLIPQLLDLSKANGTTLEEATQKAILAINGQTKGLREVGISFKDTGSKTENLAKLMGDLSKFSGAASDAMNTFSGKSEEASNKLEILQERLGKQLAPVWEGFKLGALEASESLVNLSKSAFGFGDQQPLIEKVNTLNKIIAAGQDINHLQEKERDLLIEYNKYKNLSEVQLRNGLIEEYKFLKTLSSEDEYYDKQRQKIALITELLKSKQKIEEKSSNEKIKDDLTEAGKSKAEEAAKKAAEEAKKRKEKRFEESRKEDEAQADLEITANADRWVREIKQADEAHKNLLAGEEEWNKEMEELQLINQKQFETAQKEKEKAAKKTLENIFEINKQFLETLQQASELSVTAIESRQQRQQSSIETQRVLAERGLANDLAFEERRQNELEAKKQKELKKQKRIKEEETFLNAIAKFSEDNPNTALSKALGLLAATKAAEVIFAEEGSLIGYNGQKSWKGRRHASGQDILIHGEKGEGLLSKKEVGALGGAQGFFALKSYLKSPIMERPIPAQSMQDNSGVHSRLESIEQAIKDKPVPHVEWDGLEARIETIIENGITKRTRVMRRGL